MLEIRLIKDLEAWTDISNVETCKKFTEKYAHGGSLSGQ